MGKRAVLVCGIIRKDIEDILSSLPYEADIIEMDEQLHNSPEKLRDAIQEKIDSLEGYDEIILTYLLCGNALLGIKSGSVPLRFIKGDDCIYACLCHRSDYQDLRSSSIFMSKGWLSTRRNAVAEYEETLKKYGERRTRIVYEAMYHNYRHLVYMQTEDSVSAETEEKLSGLSEIMDTDILYIDGSVELYRKLLMLEDSDDIFVLGPGCEVTGDIFRK